MKRLIALILASVLFALGDVGRADSVTVYPTGRTESYSSCATDVPAPVNDQPCFQTSDHTWYYYVAVSTSWTAMGSSVLTATRIIQPPNIQIISTGTGTVSFATGDFQKVTLASSSTITLSGATTGQSLIVKLVQDATGGRLVTWTAGTDTIAWLNGIAPTLTATPSKADIIGFIYDNGTYSQTGFAPNETP